MTANSMVQYAPATAWTTFLQELDSVSAITERIATDDGVSVYHHSAIINGLIPDKTYVYRVGSLSGWSEWNQFTTAPGDEKPFSFIWFGDPQNEIKEHCSRVFREAHKHCPDAAFWLFTGDLITEPEDILYEDFFEAAGFLFRTTPSLMAPGNHDREYATQNGVFVLTEQGRKVRKDEVADIYRKHFTQ